MRSDSETPFDNIESAQQYLRLLGEAILEAKEDVQADLTLRDANQKRAEALRLTLYILEKLMQHVKVSRRLLNDLRSLRRLLLQERQAKEMTSLSPTAPEPCAQILGGELL